MFKLRPYQNDAVDSVFEYFNSNNDGHPLVAMPPGTGKSLVIASFLKQVLERWPNQKILCITHVKELILQNYSKLITLWPGAPAGIHSASLNQKDLHSKIVFGGIGSVYRKASAFGKINLVVIDEAHLVNSRSNTMYAKFIGDLKRHNKYLRVIGLTATPFRLGQGMLTDGGIFTDVCYDLTTMRQFNKLIAELYLVPLIGKPQKLKLDVSNVNVQAGDFVLKDLQLAVDKEAITKKALEDSLPMLQQRNKWLIFTTGIDHTEHVSKIANDMGISCAPIHSKLTKEQRDTRIKAFREGQITALANNNILTTGFDDPTIDFILNLRPTESPVLWVQMMGRGTRPVFDTMGNHDLNTYEGRFNALLKKNCIVHDYGANTERLGPINGIQVPGRKRKGAKRPPPVKTCPMCDTYNHISARICINCDYEFQFENKLTLDASEANIVQLEEFKISTFKVDEIAYKRHAKIGKPDSLRVIYTCGVRTFDEYFCLQHKGYVAKKARDKMRKRIDGNPPVTVTEALALAEKLKKPTHLRIWLKARGYNEILNYDWEGTDFGKQAPVLHEIPVQTSG